MRQVGKRLRNPLKAAAPKFIHHQRQYDGRREPKDDAVNAQQHGIAHQPDKIVGIEEVDKMLDSHPRAAPNSLKQLVVLERNLHAQQRDIMKHDIVHERRQEHQIGNPVFLQISPQNSSQLLPHIHLF